MRKAIIYSLKIKDVIKNILKSFQEDDLKSLDNLFKALLEDTEKYNISFEASLLQQARTFIKKTHKQKCDFLKKLQPEERTKLAFVLLFTLTHSYIVYHNSSDLLFSNASVSSANFACEVFDNLYMKQKDEILKQSYNLFSQYYVLKNIF